MRDNLATMMPECRAGCCTTTLRALTMEGQGPESVGPGGVRQGLHGDVGVVCIAAAQVLGEGVAQATFQALSYGTIPKMAPCSWRDNSHYGDTHGIWMGCATTGPVDH